MSELAYGSRETVFDNKAVIAQAAEEIAETTEWFNDRNRQAFDHISVFLHDLETIKLKNETGHSEVGRLTAEHSLAVGLIARQIVSDWLSDPEAADLALTGGTAHDIGKLPLGLRHPHLLDPTRKFDDEDRKHMAEHSKLGYLELGAFGEQVDFDFSKEQAIIFLHHVPKRRTPLNNGQELSISEHIALERVRQSSNGPGEQVTRLKRVTLAVALADTFHAITTREYVPSEHLPKYDNRRNAAKWAAENIDVSRLGLSQYEMLGATKSLFRFIEDKAGRPMPEGRPFPRQELPNKPNRLDKIVQNVLSLF